MFHRAKTHWLYTEKESGYSFSWKTEKIKHNQIKQLLWQFYVLN